MAHGKNANKRYDRQWWGKRPLSNYGRTHRSKTNKFFKRLLHKIERRNGKEETEE